MLLVYPRVCGGTGKHICVAPCGRGLSPRVRGNRGALDLTTGKTRSIPACAGEPLRVMGFPCSRAGLSPRVRGNPPAGALRVPSPGSIPACAGEPFLRDASTGNQKVYPRVCGGTVPSGGIVSPENGLSPRVRGNLQNRRVANILARSIPACAGEPYGGILTIVLAAVYPRVCGGTGTEDIRQS